MCRVSWADELDVVISLIVITALCSVQTGYFQLMVMSWRLHANTATVYWMRDTCNFFVIRCPTDTCAMHRLLLLSPFLLMSTATKHTMDPLFRNIYHTTMTQMLMLCLRTALCMWMSVLVLSSSQNRSSLMCSSLMSMHCLQAATSMDVKRLAVSSYNWLLAIIYERMKTATKSVYSMCMCSKCNHLFQTTQSIQYVGDVSELEIQSWLLSLSVSIIIAVVLQWSVSHSVTSVSGRCSIVLTIVCVCKKLSCSWHSILHCKINRKYFKENWLTQSGLLLVWLPLLYWFCWY